MNQGYDNPTGIDAYAPVEMAAGVEEAGVGKTRLPPSSDTHSVPARWGLHWLWCDVLYSGNHRERVGLWAEPHDRRGRFFSRSYPRDRRRRRVVHRECA